jgi:hypothetical protein
MTCLWKYREGAKVRLQNIRDLGARRGLVVGTNPRPLYTGKHAVPII